jgi:alpha-tubulin suppressor-like RCC1 family protein
MQRATLVTGKRTNKRHLFTVVIALLASAFVAATTGQAPAHATTDPTANVLDWGYNYYGYLGNNSTTNVGTTPWKSPQGEHYVTQISAQVGVLALHADGSITAWGRNDQGELGTGGTNYDVLIPTRVIDVPAAAQVSSGGGGFGLAVATTGLVFSWGNNTDGNLGRSTGGSYDATPAQVAPTVLPNHIASVATGDNHTLALTTDGNIWAWGYNHTGQLGDPSKYADVYQTPFQVPGISSVMQVAAGGGSSFARKSDGTVWAWGNNYGSQGHGPQQISGLSGITQIAAGNNQALALDSSGNVWAWGSNQYGQVGNGGSTGWQSPTQLTGLSNVTYIAATSNDSFAVESNGTAWSWGANWWGQLGNGNTTQQNTPVQATGLSGFSVAGIASSSYATYVWSGALAATPVIGNGNLVTLGDSVAAGEGDNFGFYWNGSSWSQAGLTDPTWYDTTMALGGNYQDCDQSSSAYSRFFQKFDGYTVYNMACTGASVTQESALSSGSTPGGVLTKQDGKTVPKPQLGGGCTGCDTPNSVFDNHQPNVVLMTVGADDIDFKDWINECYWEEVGGCGSSGDSATLNQQLQVQNVSLNAALAELNSRAGQDLPSPQKLTVVVSDYYNPYGSTYNSACIDTGNSGLPIGITSAEQSWIVSALGQLDQSIYDEVGYAQSNFLKLNVKFVDLSGLGGFPGGQDIMAGHTFCSADPWAYGPSIDYPHWGNPILPGYPAPMHPTPEGQFAIYKAIVQQAGL